MDSNNKRINDCDLARFFIEKAQKQAIITEIFNFFGFDCFMRRSIDPDALDTLIRDFEKSDYSDCEKLTAVIALIRKGKAISEMPEKELMERIKSFVSEHLTEDISIEEIAARLNVSYYYICHFFKVQAGISLSAFRNRKRCEKAVKELCETSKKISDIATCCGFNNVSYFTEIFTKYLGSSPTAFRAESKDICIHDFYDLDDILLAQRLKSVSLLDSSLQETNQTAEVYTAFEPDDRFGFLHEAAIIEHKGILYASWYNCRKNELRGYTPICEKRSSDGGKTWTELEIIAEDKTGKILYCPPVYGIHGGRLYMFMNQMTAPDHIHSLDLYVLDERTDKFKLLWSRPIPFKLNTNVVALPNGKLMLPGRIGELDGFPNTPAVLISDSGEIDTEWRLVKIAENGDLPDGKKLVHPEISVICCGDTLYMFNRNDQRRVPIVYISRDMGESWSDALSHDIPYVSSKIYCGTLADGRNYLIANTDRFDRSKLTVYFSEKGSMKFNKYSVLFDNMHPMLNGIHSCHYPAACESNGKLYIIATVGRKDNWERRGAVVFTIDLKNI